MVVAAPSGDAEADPAVMAITPFMRTSSRNPENSDELVGL
jgi:hypothetical protein